MESSTSNQADGRERGLTNTVTAAGNKRPHQTQSIRQNENKPESELIQKQNKTSEQHQEFTELSLTGLTPSYENLNTSILAGSFQHFTLPRPHIRELCYDDTESHYNNRSGSNSTLELISNSTTSPSSSIPNQICITPPDMNNYPYHQNSNNAIYHNPYSFSSTNTSSSRDDVPYASIKQNTSRIIKIRKDNNASPATSNGTASTALSSSRSTLKRQQKSTGDFGLNLKNDGNGTIVRNGGTMSRSARAAHASTLYYSTPDHIVVPVPVQACQAAFCPSCSGVVPVPIPIPMNHLETIPEMSSLKTDPAFWNYNNNFQIPLKRNSSIGGFTLNGQPRHMRKSKMSKFCSSHKIALVVSTFSLLVTIGLVITLIFMKKKGMMDHGMI